MTTFYTSKNKQILRDDIVFIDQQLTLARNKMAEGNKAEAWSTLDGLLGYFDFKKHFSDILVKEGEYISFQDMYEALRAIDDVTEIDAIQILTGGNPLEWRPGYSRAEILRRLQEFLTQIEAWQALDWFEGEGIQDSLEILKEKIKAFIQFFQNFNVDDGVLFGPAMDVLAAKKLLWRALSDELPFAEIYELLMTMDRDLTHLVFRFRLHLKDVTLEEMERTIREIEEKKHAILAIINATRAKDESATPQPPPSDGGTPVKPPPGWDDLIPFPPTGYAFFSGGIVPIASRQRASSVGGNTATMKTRGFLLGLVIGAVIAAIVVSLLATNCTPG